jgi:tetratricopeptide (TPR) repeat protein
MKKCFVFTLITVLAFCTSQVNAAEPKKNVEANKLAREGAEAAKNQEWDKAIDLLRKATTMENKYADELSTVYQQRAYAAASEQRFQDAIGDYAEALKLTPQNARIFEQRAAVEMKMNDYDKALSDYSEIIKLKPDEVKYYNYRAYIYEVRGDVKNSMADTEKALKIDAKNQEALGRKTRLAARQSVETPLPLPPQKPRAKTSPAPGHTP